MSLPSLSGGGGIYNYMIPPPPLTLPPPPPPPGGNPTLHLPHFSLSETNWDESTGGGRGCSVVGHVKGSRGHGIGLSRMQGIWTGGGWLWVTDWNDPGWGMGSRDGPVCRGKGVGISGSRDWIDLGNGVRGSRDGAVPYTGEREWGLVGHGMEWPKKGFSCSCFIILFFTLWN